MKAYTYLTHRNNTAYIHTAEQTASAPTMSTADDERIPCLLLGVLDKVRDSFLCRWDDGNLYSWESIESLVNRSSIIRRWEIGPCPETVLSWIGSCPTSGPSVGDFAILNATLVTPAKKPPYFRVRWLGYPKTTQIIAVPGSFEYSTLFQVANPPGSLELLPRKQRAQECSPRKQRTLECSPRKKRSLECSPRKKRAAEVNKRIPPRKTTAGFQLPEHTQLEFQASTYIEGPLQSHHFPPPESEMEQNIKTAVAAFCADLHGIKKNACCVCGESKINRDGSAGAVAPEFVWCPWSDLTQFFDLLVDPNATQVALDDIYEGRRLPGGKWTFDQTKDPRPAMAAALGVLPDGLLLNPLGVDVAGQRASVCAECLGILQKGKRPVKHFLKGVDRTARMLYRDDTPLDFKPLSSVELAATSVVAVKTTIMKLATSGLHSAATKNAQRAVSGSLIVFPQTAPNFAEVLPRPAASISKFLKVVLVGDKPPAEKTLRNVLYARKDVCFKVVVVIVCIFAYNSN